MAELLLLAVLVLTGCGNLPRPMQPDDKLENPLLLLPDRAGVVIGEFADLPDDEAAALAVALTNAFLEQNVVASTVGGNAEAMRIEGAMRPGTAAQGRRVDLVLLGPSGEPLAQHGVVVAAPPGARLVKPEHWAAAAREVAAAMVPAIQPEELAGRPPPKLNVRIAEFKGAPTPTGGLTLNRALAFNLRRAKVEMTEKPGPETVTVAGEMKLTTRNAYVQRVDVVWRVTDTKGEELGKVDQANDVPKEMVERGFGELAAAIAEAAAEGIADLLSRLGPTPKAAQ